MSAAPFCADVAREEGAPLAGTASRAEVWLLLEHAGPWGADALVDDGLPAAVKEWLSVQLAALGALGKARALLVRQGDESAAASSPIRRGFVAVTREDRRELHAFGAHGEDALRRVDLASALALGSLARVEAPLTLVCVNGRRDRCCARRGGATYRALASSAAPGSVWQSTHQGGHRYAATGMWLPEGVAYGYLGPEDAAPLLAARARGAIHLPRFRGRVFHQAAVQAADALLRAELAVDLLDAWRPAGAERAGEGVWRVELDGPAGRLEALVEEREETVLAGCTPPKEKRSQRFALRSWARR